MDEGDKYAGTRSDWMNRIGKLARYVSPITRDKILSSTVNDWNLFITFMAGVYLLGMIAWPFIDPVTPLEDEA